MPAAVIGATLMWVREAPDTLNQGTMRLLYTALLYLMLPLALLRLYWRGRRDPGTSPALARAVRLFIPLCR
jgi:hypothetical protein